MQRLVIKNFGPIKDLDMEVKDFMAFIGPQASGKSTIAKMVYFFRSLKEDFLKSCLRALERDDLQFKDTFPLLRHLSDYWGQLLTIETEFKFWYSEKVFISFVFSENVVYSFSKNLDKGISEVIGIIVGYAVENRQRKPLTETAAEKAAFEAKKQAVISDISNRINKLFSDDREIMFIPAGRSVPTILSNQIGELNLNNLDYLTKEFVKLINSTKNNFNKSLEELADEKTFLTQKKYKPKTIKLAQQIIRNVLKGEYVYDNIGGERIRINDKESVRLNYASSGQQEALWILQLLYLNILYEKKVFLVIEEPEAHLYPEAQKNVMELVALLFNSADNQVMITTHSPYILSSVNNLLYANKIGQQKNGQVSKIVPDLVWLDAKRTAAYKLNKGEATYIMDDEMNMIQSEQIDTASELINEEFDKIFNLDES